MNNPLALERLSDAEQARRESAVRRLVAGQSDELELLQMLGYEPYDTVDRSSTGTGKLKHGRRSTYVKYRCRCTDCNEANNAYLRDHRQGAA